MNIDTAGRIRPPTDGELNSSSLITDGTRVYVEEGGPSHNFQTLYEANATNEEIFVKSVQPLLDLFIDGFNTSVLVYGASGSGKSFTCAGEHSGKQLGIIPQAISYVIEKTELQNALPKESSFSTSDSFSASEAGDNTRLLMCMYEIYNELIRDLIATSSEPNYAERSKIPPLEIDHDVEQGTCVKNSKCIICKNAPSAVKSFWQAWDSRNVAVTDFGSCSNSTTHIFQLELFMMTNDSPLPNRSKFTVVRLPGAEKLAEDPSHIRAHEGPNLSKSITSLHRLANDLAEQPDPARVINYGDSKLTSLLEDSLGGNCKAWILCCLPHSNDKPEVMTAVFNSCSVLSQVKNYPIVNDCLAQYLITQYRARLDTNLQLKGGAGAAEALGSRRLSDSDLNDQAMKATSANTELREKCSRLAKKMEQTENKMSEIVEAKSELASQLIASEEEKLKASRGLVEMQLENNRLSEKYETENFELNNKILKLENEIIEMQLEKEKVEKSNELAAEQSQEQQKSSGKEFATLKKLYFEQKKDLETQRKKNDDLQTKLVRMVGAESSLLNLRDNVGRQREAHTDATSELARARDILRDAKLTSSISGVALKKLKARKAELYGEMQEKSIDSANDVLTGNKEGMLSQMTKISSEQTRKLEQRLLDLKEQLTLAYSSIQNFKKKCAEQTTVLSLSKDEQKTLSEENSSLQLQIKEMGEDYKKRLRKYVEDIAEFTDCQSQADGDNYTGFRLSKPQRMTNYIDGMLKDMKAAFRSREEQLSKAAHKYKHEARRVSHRHEKLLIHYRILRDQLESILSSADGHFENIYIPLIDLGPDPSEILVIEDDLISENTVELNTLRTHLARVKSELTDIRAYANRQRKFNRTMNLQQVAPSSYSLYGPTQRHTSFPPMRMRDLGSNAIVERDRAEWLSKAKVAEQQLREQQQYIDTHLARYKHEIQRLRHLVSERGLEGDDANYLSSELSLLSPRLSRRKQERTEYGF